MTQPLDPDAVSELLSYGLDLRAEQYYRGLDPTRLDPERVASAIEDARTRIDEWSYEQDAHGYCHDRTDWIALVAEIQRLRQLLLVDIDTLAHVRQMVRERDVIIKNLEAVNVRAEQHGDR